jgi:hypothetical protein
MTTTHDTKWNAHLYDDKHNFVFKFGEDVVQLLNPRKGERILDLGCGTGYLTHLIAQAGARVIGIDKSQADDRTRTRRLPRSRLPGDVGYRLPFRYPLRCRILQCRPPLGTRQRKPPSTISITASAPAAASSSKWAAKATTKRSSWLPAKYSPGIIITATPPPSPGIFPPWLNIPPCSKKRLPHPVRRSLRPANPTAGHRQWCQRLDPHVRQRLLQNIPDSEIDTILEEIQER